MESSEDIGEILCNSFSTEPALRVAPVIEKGRILCGICFTGSTIKNKRRSGINEVQDVEKFKERALRWTNYEHEYNSVYGKHNWSMVTKLYAHKTCRTNFFKENVMTSQKVKPANNGNNGNIETLETDMDTDENHMHGDTEDIVGHETEEVILRRSARSQHAYTSTKENVTCIICKEEKKDTHARPLDIKSMTFKKNGEKEHKVEKQMYKFAEIHVKNETRYKDAGERILLTKSSKSLFVADVGYHESCYANFRSPKWEKDVSATRNKSQYQNQALADLLDLIEYLIVGKKEIYTLAQLRDFYDTMCCDDDPSLRSIDIKFKIEERFKDKILFCTPSYCSSSNTTEYVLPAGSNIMPDTIHSITTGEGITNCLQLKAICRSISEEIQSYRKRLYPPPPQDLIEGKEKLNERLYNNIAWIVSPNANMGKDGFVKLPPGKAVKVRQICENIQSLVPNAAPSFGQILLSMTMYSKTGSKRVIDDLHRLGAGISYTDVLFVQDKWADWAEKQCSIIPSNIEKGLIATHVFDNLDWQNKHGRVETHHTNSIIIQKSNLTEKLASVSLKPDYDFNRKEHRSFKGVPVFLPPVNFKRGTPKIWKYVRSDEYRHSEISSLKTIAWVLARLRSSETKSMQMIPSWSEFQALSSNPDIEPLTVGYLPPIPESPTDMRVIYAAIRRTQSIMKELETKFIFIEGDQAIYTKVLDAMFRLEEQNENIFDEVIPRMGGFHIIMCMLKTIYALFKDCGLIQLLSSAGLGGLGTTKKYLNGSDVKEGIILHKKLFEALMRLKVEYIKSKSENVFDPSLLDTMFEGINIPSVYSVVKSLTSAILPRLQEGAMAQLLEIYLDMTNLLLNFIHFQRTGNWSGTLEVIFCFLPYCFRLNRLKYARDLSFYYVHMRALKDENKEAFDYLENGGFSGSLSGKPHSSIPFDQVIEMTINRSSKDTGGLARKTQNQGAIQRWTRTNHVMVALREHLDKHTGRKKGDLKVKIGAHRIQKEERDVIMIKSLLERRIPEMWAPTQPIVHFATGVTADEDMVRDTLSIRKTGESLRDNYLQKISSPQSKKDGYYSKIKKQDIKLFKKKKDKKRPSISVDESQSFTEVFALFDKQKLDLCKIMEWPVFSKPWAIVNEDMKSRSNHKHLFRKELQMMCPTPPSTTAPAGIETAIVDAMRVVRLMSVTGLAQNTFRCWVNNFVDYLRGLPGNIMHIIFDDYNYQYQVPTKMRDTSGVEREINDLSQELPTSHEWTEFLANTSNKFHLVNLIVDHIKSPECRLEREVYINNGPKCFFKDLDNVCHEFSELNSNHREADQKIHMHVVFAGRCKDKPVCVIADDTDIYISLIYIAHHVQSKLYFRQGKVRDKDGITYHDIHSIAEELGEQICAVLPAFHALTGSDFTHPFFGRTKVSSFRQMLKKSGSQNLLKSLAAQDVNTSEVTAFILQIVYNRPKKEKTPGESRYNMLLTRKAKSKTYPSSKCIPPDQKSLNMKILRANYVTHCMVHCLVNDYIPLDPSEYG